MRRLSLVLTLVGVVVGVLVAVGVNGLSTKTRENFAFVDGESGYADTSTSNYAGPLWLVGVPVLFGVIGWIVATVIQRRPATPHRITYAVAGSDAADDQHAPAPPFIARPNRATRKRPVHEIPVNLDTVVSVVATGDISIWLWRFEIFSTGLAFRVEGRIRDPQSWIDAGDRTMGALNAGRLTRPTSATSVGLTLRFADGKSVSVEAPPKRRTPR